MVSYLSRMPMGIPGDVSRGQNSHIESNTLLASNGPAAYGLPVKIVSGKIQAIVAGDLAAVVYGYIVRPFPYSPSPAPTGGDVLGAGIPPAAGIVDIMRRGYMTVLNQLGTPIKGQPVYMRNANPSGNQIVGGLEAGSTANNVVLNATFAGSADANGNVEIEANI